MPTLTEVEQAAESLSPDELAQLLRHLSEKLITAKKTHPKVRVAGLGLGMMTMSPDFDDPLPEELWLGKDA